MEDIIFEESILYKVISFFSDHFELLIYINGTILITFVVVIAAVTLKNVPIRRIVKSTVNDILLAAVVIGQCLLFYLIGYIYWQNYQRPAPVLSLQASEKVSAGTFWVNNDTKIYFIEGNALKSVTVDDRESETVYQAKTPVREYHFSPDGRHLLILTVNELLLMDRRSREVQRIDALEPVVQEKESAKGSIGAVQWAPDSKKFVYEMARWSPYSAQDDTYVYDVAQHRKRAIKSPTRPLVSLYWDRQSENLYSFYHEAKDPAQRLTAYEVKVYRVPLDTLMPDLMLRVPSDKTAPPVGSMQLRGIDLYLEGEQYAFGRPGRENNLVAENGFQIGIDEEDYLYYIRGNWFRKRLYKISREPRQTEIPRYQYRGGELVIDHIRWLPGGRYVIMEHKYWGVLILEPSSGRIGLLLRARGHTFGWYLDDKA